MEHVRAVSAEPLGKAGVSASWRLGNGAVLTIGANFGASALSWSALGGILFATPGGTAATLPPRSCVAILEPPQ
jgi:maltooligosyltrehalose trehalohydrolase